MAANNNTDPEVWTRKDKLMSRMAAVKAISIICEGTNVPEDEVLKRADRIYSWIGQDQEWVDDSIPFKPADAPTYPVPTVKQKEWLDRIEEKHGFSVAQVYDKLGKYPGNKNDALKVVKMLKEM